MNPLVLADEWTLLSIEEANHRIDASNGAPLQVNKDWLARRKGALHDAARLQLLSTWARKTKEPNLRFHAANEVKTVLEELCEYAPGIVALRLCESAIVGEHIELRRDALKPAITKMQATDNLQWSKIVRGRTIDFTCVSGSKIQYLRPLFASRSSSAVKGAEPMYQMLKSLSNYIAKSDAELIPDTFLRACGVFSSELIKNTQEHATRNHAGIPYIEHAEGLLASWTEMDEQFAIDFQGHELLQQFWEREQSPVREGAANALRCLQLSFFDTGPGFASRFSGLPTTDLNDAEERNALLKSIQKNVTTKRQTGAGNGLPDVIGALRKIGGLIAIRSGRLFMFNSFEPNDKRDLFDFVDWTPTKLAPVEGVVVSVLVPLRRK
ncbi:hypothetical protein [Bordetella trematum]|uniref:hypothetical protein n=1 Tax=Bordetella trematum TaxID=123899 RepID=UPI003AF37431